VLRALRREGADAFLAELDARERPAVERALAEADESSARRLVETMAIALQSTLLGDSLEGEAFRAREQFGAFGTLPSGLPLAEIAERHSPLRTRHQR
jgi:putative acyl-CoA dehydrogenase